MERGEPQVTDQIGARIQEILVADGLADTKALAESQSLCEGLGYYQRVTGRTGLHFIAATMPLRCGAKRVT